MFDNLVKLKVIFTRRELLQFSLLLVAIIAMAFTQALGVASVMPFIGLVMEPDMIYSNHYLNMVYETLNFTTARSFIIFAGLVMFFIIIFSNIISVLATWLKLKLAWMNNYRLSRRLLEKYLSMPYAFFLNRNSAELSNKVLDEVGTLTNKYIIPILTIITRVLVVAFILAMLLLVNVWISLLAIFLLGGTYALIYWRINRNLKVRGDLRIQAAQARFKAASEAFGGIKEIKVVNRERFFLDIFSHQSWKLARLSAWHAVISELPRYGLEAVAFGGIIIFILFLLITQEDARQVIPLASLFAFAGYRLMPAMQEIFKSLTNMKYAQAVLDRIYNDMTEGKELEYSKEDIEDVLPEPLAFKHTLALNEISYAYPSCKQPVLSGITLTIKKNTAVAFVGFTGAGKTTLVDIILGLLMPQEGAVVIDDKPLTEENMKSWQRNLGYVPQHIYLTDDTVTRNIAFGIPEYKIDLEAVQQAAQIANIDHFIVQELPNGYDTLVGERGVRLSGGQRQRIGIARALYHYPQVLVFDEATSALDGITEEAVLQAMENASRLKTLIVIAHRLTTVKKCNTIYILDRGKITASGIYDELISCNEQFKKMAKAGAKN